MPRAAALSATTWEGRRLLFATPFLQFLAHVLHGVDGADVLLPQPPAAPDHLAQVLVHHDVARRRVDHDRAARAVELPALERLDGLLGIELSLEPPHRSETHTSHLHSPDHLLSRLL